MADRTAKEIIAAARRPERSYELCLRGDLQAEWEALDRRLRDLTLSSPTSLEGDDRVEVAAQMADLETEMRGAMLTLRLRALRRDTYQSLLAQHPPRVEPKEPADDADADALEQFSRERTAAARDRQHGYNVDSFFPALLQASIVAPELDDEDWDNLLDAMTDAQFEDLCGVALLLNRGEVSVPFSPTASRLTRSSAQS